MTSIFLGPVGAAVVFDGLVAGKGKVKPTPNAQHKYWVESLSSIVRCESPLDTIT